jgi:hypothetical protein
MLGFCDIQFQEQEDVSEDSNLISNNDIETLVEGDMVEEDSMLISQIGLEIEGVSDGYINGDITFSSSNIEQGPLIFTQNLSLNQSLHDNVSLEVVNEVFLLKGKHLTIYTLKYFTLCIQIYLLTIVYT